jgi:GH15 family glucan-1,4-alpha-glucosidase
MHIMYGIRGERWLPELRLDWLPGHAGSRPVRIGNAASSQLQLDVYGEVMDVFHQGRRAELAPHDAGWDVQLELMEFLEGAWQLPDEGIWEVRGGQQHFVHSKIMAWVAFDRAVLAVERFGQEGPADRWQAAREEIRREVCEKGWDAERETLTQYYGSRELDASLLMAPLVGFLPPSHPIMRGTVAAIERELCESGFVHRYTRSGVDGLSGHEGAFLLCTSWLADNFALTGRYDDAWATFERIIDVRNDVGLLSEEWDVSERRMLGNFPQAFSHVGLINTAVNLARTYGPADQRAASGQLHRVVPDGGVAERSRA